MTPGTHIIGTGFQQPSAGPGVLLGVEWVFGGGHGSWGHGEVLRRYKVASVYEAVW